MEDDTQSQDIFLNPTQALQIKRIRSHKVLIPFSYPQEKLNFQTKMDEQDSQDQNMQEGQDRHLQAFRQNNSNTYSQSVVLMPNLHQNQDFSQFQISEDFQDISELDNNKNKIQNQILNTIQENDLNQQQKNYIRSQTFVETSQVQKFKDRKSLDYEQIVSKIKGVIDARSMEIQKNEQKQKTKNNNVMMNYFLKLQNHLNAVRKDYENQIPIPKEDEQENQKFQDDNNFQNIACTSYFKNQQYKDILIQLNQIYQNINPYQQMKMSTQITNYIEIEKDNTLKNNLKDQRINNFTSNNQYIIFANDQLDIFFYIQKTQSIFKIDDKKPRNSLITSIDISPDNQTCLVGHENGMIQFFDLQSRKKLKEINFKTNQSKIEIIKFNAFYHNSIDLCEFITINEKNQLIQYQIQRGMFGYSYKLIDTKQFHEKIEQLDIYNYKNKQIKNIFQSKQLMAIRTQSIVQIFYLQPEYVILCKLSFPKIIHIQFNQNIPPKLQIVLKDEIQTIPIESFKEEDNSIQTKLYIEQVNKSQFRHDQKQIDIKHCQFIQDDVFIFYDEQWNSFILNSIHKIEIPQIELINFKRSFDPDILIGIKDNQIYHLKLVDWKTILDKKNDQEKEIIIQELIYDKAVGLANVHLENFNKEIYTYSQNFCDELYRRGLYKESIEFLIKIEGFMYLFGQLYDKFKSNDQLELYISSLEKYIISQQIKTIKYEVLIELFEFYRKKQNKEMTTNLEKILIKYNLHQDDNLQIISLCQKFQLFMVNNISSLLSIYLQFKAK